MLKILKDKIAKLESLRSSLNADIKHAENNYLKKAYINLCYSDYEKVVYALNVLYGIEKEMELSLI